MPLPTALSAYADLDALISAAIEHGGLRIPASARGCSHTYFAMRFGRYRKLLQHANDPRGGLAMSFTLKQDDLGDTLLEPRRLDLSAIRDLDGNVVSINPNTPRRSLVDVNDIAHEAARLRDLLKMEDGE